MTGKFSIPKTQTYSRHPSAVSGLGRSRQARRLRRARPLLDPLEERCLLNFGSPSLFDTGGVANNAAVAIGDVNGDGIPDLVTATTTGVLSIAQGYGDGTFQTPINIPTPATSFSAVKLVDLGGKNGLDIVAADQKDNGGEIWVFLNQGGGTFTPSAYDLIKVPMPPAPAPVAMAVAGATANLNGDTTADLNGRILGNPGFAADIVIAGGNNVIVLLGNGNETFQPPDVIPVGPDDPVAVALGDFDNSLVNNSLVNKPCYPDIITANEAGNSVSVLLGEGNGTFRPTMDIPITVPRPSGSSSTPSSNPVGVAVGDFNGDGNLDFVTANYGWPSVSVVLGNGDGSFGTPQTIDTLIKTAADTDPNDPDPPTAVVAADLSGDGFVDIAFSEPNHNSIGVLTGNGDGTFATRVDYPAGVSPGALVTGNLNGEKTSLGNDRLDLVAVDFTKSQVSILLGQKLTTTTTLDLNVSTITWGGAFDVTPVVNTGYASQPLPLTGSYQLYVDGNPYSVPQPLNTTLVLTELPATTHKLYAIFLGDNDYQDSTTSTSTITVVPAELTVTALNQTRAYGAADPSITPDSYGITGFVNGDSYEPSEVENPQVISITYTDKASSPVGNYTINCSQTTLLIYKDTNYVIDPTFISGILTITPAPLTITAKNVSMTYGDGTTLDDSNGFTHTGLQNGDTVGSVTLLTPNATISSSLNYNAGTWTITPSAAIFSSGSSSNYTITYDNASTGLTVAQIALTCSAPSVLATREYNGTTDDQIIGSATLDTSPVVGGDKVFLVSNSATANFADPNVGTDKTVTFSGYSLSGADAADYALTQPTSPTSADITPATLLITATPQTQTYGFGGIQYGGTPASLGTTGFTAVVGIYDSNNNLIKTVPMYGSDSVTSVTLSTDATKSTSLNYNAGGWDITPSAAICNDLSNYTPVYITAKYDPTAPYVTGLTIAKSPLTITANNQSRTYGANDSGISWAAGLTGFLKGDGENTSELTGTLTFICTDGYNSTDQDQTGDNAKETAQQVGTYLINISQPVTVHAPA